MQLTQDNFDQIVKVLVDQLDDKHAHVQTVTSNRPAQPFHIGYSTAADALQVALERHGVTVIENDSEMRDIKLEALKEARDVLNDLAKDGSATAIQMQNKAVTGYMRIRDAIKRIEAQ